MPVFAASDSEAKFSKVRLYPSDPDDAEGALSPISPRGDTPRLKPILMRSAVGLGAFAAIAVAGVKLSSSFRAARVTDASEVQELDEECSGPDEDCRSSKCCKQPGQTCFAKNEWWATCLTTCSQYHDNDPNPAAWSCEALGDKTPLPLTCAWAGGDCSQTKLCCQFGFECAVKDETWQSCVQVQQLDGTKVPIPSTWLGTKLGGWRSEKKVKPAAPGLTLGTSMFCFMAILSGSAEEKLVDLAWNKKSGIFACEDSRIYHSQSSKYKKWDTGVSTLVNTDIFVEIWHDVKVEGKYKHQDWTVKADADCIFFPDRLRQHLAGLKAPRDTPLYVKNTMEKFTNGGFLGAIEILTSSAVQKFVGHAKECEKHIGTQSGEDGFLKDCMDAIGIGFMHDDLLMHPSGLPADCQVKEFASYHPFKSELNWTKCYDVVQGYVPPEHMFGGSIESFPPSIRGLYADKR